VQGKSQQPNQTRVLTPWAGCKLAHPKWLPQKVSILVFGVLLEEKKHSMGAEEVSRL